MPSYKLSYFDATGKAELTRLCFAYGELKFEDFRFTREEFPALKETYPTKQAPVLEVDGVMYSQSIAIARYVAKQVGLYPKDDLLALKADMVVDTLTDVVNAAMKVLFGSQDGTPERETMMKNLLDVQMPKYYGSLNALVSGKFFCGDSPTYADIFLTDLTTTLFQKAVPQVTLESYKNLANVVENVRKLPSIEAYYEKKV